MIIDMILSHPLTPLCLTIGAFVGSQWVHKKLGSNQFLSPVVMATVAIVLALLVLDIPYDRYIKDVNLITFFLGPAVVALAVPLYQQITLIKQASLAIIITTSTMFIIAALSGYYSAQWLGGSEAVQLAITTKSVTTPITIGIAESIGASAPLAIFFIFVTGISGITLAPAIFKLCRVTSHSAQGFAIGLTCHALGITRAMQISNRAGAFAALGMSLMGIVSGILLPIFILWLIG